MNFNLNKNLTKSDCQLSFFQMTTLIAGFTAVLGGVASFASMFKTQSMSMIVGKGQGKGFWDFYSTNVYAEIPVALENWTQFFREEIDDMMKDQCLGVQEYKDKFLGYAQKHLKFESGRFDKGVNLLNSIGYNKGTGNFYMNLYTFEPKMSVFNEKCVVTKLITVSIKLEMAKDWLIMGHIKSNFFSAKCSNEIKYVPEKDLELHDVIQAVGIGLFPIVLGFVQVPPEFLNAMELAIKEEYERMKQEGLIDPHMNDGIREDFKDIRDRQDKYTREGIDGINDAWEKLTGEKGKKPESNSAAALYARRLYPELVKKIQRRQKVPKFLRRIIKKVPKPVIPSPLDLPPFTVKRPKLL